MFVSGLVATGLYELLVALSEKYVMIIIALTIIDDAFPFDTFNAIAGVSLTLALFEIHSNSPNKFSSNDSQFGLEIENRFDVVRL